MHENYHSNLVPELNVLLHQRCIQYLLLTYVETLLTMVNVDVANTLYFDEIERPARYPNQFQIVVNRHILRNFKWKIIKA